MKSLLLTVVLLGVLLVVESKGRKCYDQDDCNEGECCVLVSLPSFVSGECKNLSKAGEACREHGDYMDVLGGKHLKNCPCVEGLKCIPKEDRDSTFGKVKIESRCVDESASTRLSTRSTRDYTGEHTWHLKDYTGEKTCRITGYTGEHTWYITDYNGEYTWYLTGNTGKHTWHITDNTGKYTWHLTGNTGEHMWYITGNSGEHSWDITGNTGKHTWNLKGNTGKHTWHITGNTGEQIWNKDYTGEHTWHITGNTGEHIWHEKNYTRPLTSRRPTQSTVSRTTDEILTTLEEVSTSVPDYE